MIIKKLSHWGERNTKIDMLVLHCSTYLPQKMVALLNEQKLSVHYIVGTKGGIIKCVDEDKRAYHAGVGAWRGSSDSVNARSIGIEVVSPTLGQTKYNQTQITSLIKLCSCLVKKYKIPAYNVVGHSDVAPYRKADPGRAFPWQKLAQNGIGLWYDLENADKVKSDDITELLTMIGYDISDDNKIVASAYAFCRHFAPKFVHYDANVMHLVDNILPNDFSFMQNDDFLQILKAVAFEYNLRKQV